MMRNLFLLCFLWTGLSLQAQSVADALRFSQSVPTITARNMAVGGALGALGGDFSSVHSNPAGLGIFRSSEFVLTPSIFTDQTDAQLLDDINSNVIEDSKRNFHLHNLGIVLFHQPRNVRWKTANIAIGFSRLNNYHQEFTYAGTTTGSITDRFLNLAEGLSLNELDPFEAGPAFDAGAIFEFPDGSGEYFSDFLPEDLVDREENFESSGALNELTFALGGNYMEKLMVGATVGVPFIRYEQIRTYAESDEEGRVPFFDELQYIESLVTEGTGVNLKLGLIYRLNQMIRLGMALHTPTVFAVTDNYSTQMEYAFTDNSGNQNRFNAESPIQVFDYRIRTPWRVMGNAGFIIGRKGFITAELEWIDYASASFNLTSTANNGINRENERILNDELEDTGKSAVSFRVGGEFVLAEIFRLRGGLNVSETPFANDDDQLFSYSLGLGIREQAFYIDLAYRGTARDETYAPYFIESQAGQLVDLNRSTSQIALSVGFTF